MPDRATDRRSNRGLHAVLVVLGAALGIAAVCLIVFGTTSPKHLLVGIILGLWAALLAAFGLPGMRHAAVDNGVLAQDLEVLQAELSALADTTIKTTQEGLKATQDSITSQGQDIRRMNELQVARETAVRREADLSLQLAIRREIERTVADQFGSLREEVSSLRAEVVDRLDGQIKLERIEITRVIGSDLEALQNEVRRLASQRESADLDSRASRKDFAAQPAGAPTVDPRPAADSAAGPDRDDIIDAEVIEASAADAAPPTQPAASAATASTSFSQAWGPVRAVRAKAPESTSAPVQPEPPAPPPVQPEPPAPPPQPLPPPELPPYDPPPTSNGSSYRKGADIFADLPRLTPISPELLGLSGKRRAPEEDPSSPKYVGRRRPEDVPNGSEAQTWGEVASSASSATSASSADSDRDGPPSANSDGGSHGRRRAPGHASD